MSVAETIKTKLTAAFSPVLLDVIDESALHAGHVGARPEGETHFRVVILAGCFSGHSRIVRQRMVHDVLAEELTGPVHALSVRAGVPDDRAGPG